MKRGQCAKTLPVHLKKRSSDPPKESRIPTPQILELEHNQISSHSHVCNAYTSSTPVPDRNPSKESILSPEWTHAITALMGHSLSSESEKSMMQKCILYHAIQDPTNFRLILDPTDPDDINLLQKYVKKWICCISPKQDSQEYYQPLDYMYLLIKREKPVDQKCNVVYLLLDDQCFILTANDIKTTLVNAGMEYHNHQIIPGTSLPNSTSPHLLNL